MSRIVRGLLVLALAIAFGTGTFFYAVIPMVMLLDHVLLVLLTVGWVMQESKAAK